jgi:two-component system OmpR family sensor kinase
VVLMAVCAGITIVTQIGIQQVLRDRLDVRLEESLVRAQVIDGQEVPRAWRFPPGTPVTQRVGPDFLDAPGLPRGFLGASVVGGRAVDAGVLQSAPGATTPWETVKEPVSASATGQLDNIGPRPQTRLLDGLGPYRLMSGQSYLTGETLVVGLSLTGTERAIRENLRFLVVLSLYALALAIVSEVFILRRALAPLNRIVNTADHVAAMPLERGEVEMPVRVAVRDANPDTEVGRVGLALNRLLDHVEVALSERHASETRVRQFVADASHELRTPLAAVRGYSEIARRGGGDVPGYIAYALERVESQSARMTELVDDLLLLARLDEGRPLVHGRVDLSALCVEGVADAEAAAGPERRWSLEIPAEAVIILGDGFHLQQVLANLLTNARIHTPAGTAVAVRLAAGSDGAVLTVADNGPGIPAELQSEVFGRFTRGSEGRSGPTRSTGLGLAIVRAVVQAHGGSVAVRSEPGNTVFTVRLPGSPATHT